MISLNCPYCATNFITATPQTEASEAALRAAWKAQVSATPMICECVSCNGSFQIADDGIPTVSGGSVELSNVSKPRIDSLNVAAGPREGGNVLIVTGHALDAGALVVKFADEASPTVDNRTETTARVVVPPATYMLSVLERCTKLTLSVVSGSLAVDEAVTSTAGSSGVIRLIEGSVYWIAFGTLVEELNDMVGTNLTGGGSGGVRQVDAAVEVPFTVGENVIGLSSVVVGVVRSDTPLAVVAPTGGYAPNELVQGASSGALAKLTSSPAYSGLVDVSVENEFGQRLAGGSLPGVYTYA